MLNHLQQSRLFNNLTPKQQQRCLSQIHSDIADRSLPGTFIYMLTWFCIAYLVTGNSDDVKSINWIGYVSILMIITAIFRVGMILLSKRLLTKPKTCRWILITGLTVSSLSWGLMASCAFFDTPLASQRELIFLSTVGLCGGGAISFTASRFFTWLFLICMFLPIVFVELFITAVTNLETIIVVVVYSIGLISATKTPYKEYRAALIGNLQLEEISNTDSLTGIRNRRYFDMQLTEEIQRAQRNNSPLSLLIIDIDYFKKINDEFGHPIGDQCLIDVAARLSNCLNRISDTVARHGGEEFAIILPYVTEDKCRQLAEKVRLEVANTPFQLEDRQLDITISIGCYSMNSLNTDVTPTAFISNADKALYQAKKSGRNRVEFEMG